MRSKEETNAETQLRENVRFLSQYYDTLTEENFSETYQYHFNETPFFDRAGFRSALDFFTSGSNLANSFGISRDHDNPNFNFKLKSCNYKGERPPVPQERKLDVKVYDNKGELPLRYRVYTEDFRRLWDRSHRRRVVTTEPYQFIPFEADTEEIQLVVLQAENPEDFVAHIRGDYYANWMEELMKNLKSFFHSSKNQMKYSIADYPNFVTVGQPCVVRVNDIYWRAVISDVTSGGPGDDDTTVLCLLVDHGQLLYVHRSCIFVIDKTFLALPMQAIQLRIDGIKSKVKKWATSAKDYVNTDCGTKASTCYIKKKYAECLGVDLKHAGSDELVSNTLIRKKLAIEDTDASKLSAALQTIYYYPPCKAYADVLRKINREYILDCVHVKSAADSVTSASSEDSGRTKDAFAAVPTFRGPSNLIDVPPGFTECPPQQFPQEPPVMRPRRNSLEGWGENEDDVCIPNEEVRPQEEAFDFSSISKELSEFDDVIKSSGDHGSTHRAYQLLTPVSLTHSKRVLQCSVIPDQIITLFVVDDQTGYFSVQDRIKFTHENIGNIHPSEIFELAVRPSEKKFSQENNLLTGSRLLCCEMWKTFNAVVRCCRTDDEQFMESFILLLKFGIKSDD